MLLKKKNKQINQNHNTVIRNSDVKCEIRFQSSVDKLDKLKVTAHMAPGS